MFDRLEASWGKCSVGSHTKSQDKSTPAVEDREAFLPHYGTADALVAKVNNERQEWNRERADLTTYGLSVLGAWISTGAIYARCRDRGLGGLPPPQRQLDADETAELAGETVALALKSFSVHGARKKWNPVKGGSLRSYFIGQCILQFSNVYRVWRTQEAQDRRAVLVGDLLEFEVVIPATPSVDRDVIASLDARRILAEIRDDRVRFAMLRVAQGFSQRAIAEELGVSTKSVERMLANERKRLRTRAHFR